jgi:hypothetical protein
LVGGRAQVGDFLGLRVVVRSLACHDATLARLHEAGVRASAVAHAGRAEENTTVRASV